MNAALRIRPARPQDTPALAQLFTDAVHRLGEAHYDAAQRAAWAPRPPDTAGWAERLAALRVRVAEVDSGRMAGFIGFSDDGHIDLLFTAPDCARRGVATALYAEAVQALRGSGVQELFTEASRVARPFFAAQGFSVTDVQEVARNGVTLQRFAMRRAL